MYMDRFGPSHYRIATSPHCPNGDAGCRGKPLNELAEFLQTAIEPYADGGETDTCIRLGSMCWRAGDANGPRNGADGSSHHDGSVEHSGRWIERSGGRIERVEQC